MRTFIDIVLVLSCVAVLTFGLVSLGRLDDKTKDLQSQITAVSNLLSEATSPIEPVVYSKVVPLLAKDNAKIEFILSKDGKMYWVYVKDPPKKKGWFSRD